MALQLEAPEQVAPKRRTRVPTIALVSTYDIENNAVRMLAAHARRSGYRAIEIYFKDWVNNHFTPPTSRELDAFIDLLRQHQVDLVAISIRASAYHKLAKQLTDLVHQRLDLPVVWGGTHVILTPDYCIKEADYVCLGEGDQTIPDMLRGIDEGIDLSTLPNLLSRKPDGIVRNKVLPAVADLDAVPFRDYTSPDKFWITHPRVIQGDPMVSDPQFQIMCSRGCVYVCSYCYNSTLEKIMGGRKSYFRMRSVDNVLAEIKLARESAFRNMKRIRFDDEVFIFDRVWIEEFCDRYPKEVGLPFEIFIEPKLVQPDKFEKLRAAGLQALYMGVQNSSRVTKELYDRRVSAERIQDAAALFNRLGIDPRYHVIVDDPLSTEQDKRDLYDLLLSLPRSYEVYLFSLVIFPNTTLANKLLKEGVITEKDVEGENQKTFQQMRVSLNYPRPPDDLFWCAMLVLVSKNFLPVKFLQWLSHSRFFRKHPRVLAAFAQACNVVKMASVCFRMVLKGELTATLLRRWLNVKSLISQ